LLYLLGFKGVINMSMNNEKLYEFMTKMHSEMQEGFEKVYANMQEGFKNVYADMQEGFKKVDKRFDALETRVDRIEKTVFKIEHDHGQKLQALFDGYKQHTDQLERIEKEVAKHDEFILKRIK